MQISIPALIHLKVHDLSASTIAITAGAVVLVPVVAVVLRRVFRKRPTPEDLERQRREMLVKFGRIVDSTLLDIYETEAEDGQTRSMLLYTYRIGGVDYECSQDITYLQGARESAQARVGFPASIRYQPGNPQNSIMLAEKWSGLHAGGTIMPEPTDLFAYSYSGRESGS